MSEDFQAFHWTRQVSKTMKHLPDHYLEKFSEELNDSLDLYQRNGEVPKHVVDTLHFELVGLFKKNVEYFACNIAIAPK